MHSQSWAQPWAWSTVGVLCSQTWFGVCSQQWGIWWAVTEPWDVSWPWSCQSNWKYSVLTDQFSASNSVCSDNFTIECKSWNVMANASFLLHQVAHWRPNWIYRNISLQLQIQFINAHLCSLVWFISWPVLGTLWRTNQTFWLLSFAITLSTGCQDLFLVIGCQFSFSLFLLLLNQKKVQHRELLYCNICPACICISDWQQYCWGSLDFLEMVFS